MFSTLSVYSEEQNFTNIVENINTSKGKTFTMSLRLKRYNIPFETLVFYDMDNIDIDFDMKELIKRRSFRFKLKRLHRGMFYDVTFVVKGVTTDGVIIADIVDFIPSILRLLP